MKLCIRRTTGSVEVLLLPYKDGRGWGYINLTKGHICPCVFKNQHEALADLQKQGDVVGWTELEGRVTR